jgi:maltose alpha-D-glucosyltransferase/alpha-amylase
VRTLGRRTAELHAALARSIGDAAFDPERIMPGDVTRWVKRAHDEAVVALDHLEHGLSRLPEAAQEEARGLLAQRATVLARIDAHAADRSVGSKTRVHGDYHLGQVLLVQNDFVISDFEGEPARPIAERREKLSPLKDVAGMLRSFDYAMHAALLRERVERPGLRTHLDRIGGDWLTQTRKSFSAGYDEVAKDAALATCGSEATGLLELFLLEKSLYELRYEVDNRPDWVRIPLRGLLDILGSPR